MTIHLDTNFLVGISAAGEAEDRALTAWLQQGALVRTSAICWSEYLCGPLQTQELEAVRAIVGAPLPFTELDAELAARLYNLGGRRRGSLADCQIAAAAMRSGAWLATGNPADFARFATAGLVLAPS
ncbi:MAG: type II toxin-antitoxin system VapC family toxin [Terriglobales bacterium]